MAWTFVSTASNLCQTLGYHRLAFPRESEKPFRAAQERLFWTVHELDKGLSLRLGRPSNICDTRITISFEANVPRHTRLARIQGKAYDQLCSPAAPSQPSNECGHMIEVLSRELQEIIDETRAECFVGLHCSDLY